MDLNINYYYYKLLIINYKLLQYLKYCFVTNKINLNPILSIFFFSACASALIIISSINRPYFFPGISRRRLTSKGGNFPCLNSNCDSVFSTKKNRNRHYKHLCGKPPRYKCAYCELTSNLRGNIKEHSKRKHTNFKIQIIDLY